MSNKITIGIIVVALLAGIAFLIISNNTRGSVPSTVAIPQATSEPTSQATASSQVTQEQNSITLTSTGFSPSILNIKAEDKVTWVNKSGTNATVHSSPHPTHTDYTPLNLGIFSDGGTLSLDFDKPGTYRYHNHLNASQFGSIVVQ